MLREPHVSVEDRVWHRLPGQAAQRLVCDTSQHEKCRLERTGRHARTHTVCLYEHRERKDAENHNSKVNLLFNYNQRFANFRPQPFPSAV